MGLLDGLLGGVLGNLGGDNPKHADLASGVLDMLGDAKGGGILQVLGSFQANGLGHLVESWIGTGANLPTTAQQILKGLGPEKVAALAQRAGLSNSEVTSKLAEFLPVIIDKLTPNGKVEA